MTINAVCIYCNIFEVTRRGYIISLKRPKFLFGQKSKIAQVTLHKVTHGKVIQNEDIAGLMEYYYCISDCLVTLRLLNYESDLHSSGTLRQAARRLPSRLHTKWAEHCLRIRRKEEPSLVHFGAWLQDRVMAQKESCLPERQKTPK